MRRRIFVCFLFCVMLIGCSRKDGKEETSSFDSDKKYYYSSNIVAADDGIYFIDRKDGYNVLKYVDKESGKAAVLCQNVNCRHDSNECQAVREEPAMICTIVYADGYLYSLENLSDEKVDEEGRLPINLYRRNKDGTGKTLLHEFREGIDLPCGGGIYQGKFAVSIQTIVNYEDGMGSTGGAPSIILYDMETKQETKIVDGHESPNQFSEVCGGIDHTFYYYEIPSLTDASEETNVDMDKCVLRKYDFETGKVSEFWSGDKSNLQLIENDVMYLKTEGNKKVELYHFDTGERETVLELEEDVDNIYIGQGFIQLVKQTKQDEGIIESYKWYDLESKKYLFDDYQLAMTINVHKLEGIGYWIKTESEWYLYRPDTGKRIDIEEL